MGAIADDGDIGLDVLVDRGAVDIDVDLLRSGREGIDPPGDAVVEARADADHHVAIVHGVVGFVGAVHAEHAEPLRVGGGIGAEPHQRRGDGKAGHADELAQFLAGAGPGIDDAAAAIEDRALGARHQLDRLRDRALIAAGPRVIALVLRIGEAGVLAARELDVLRDIDHDRSGTAGTRDVERLVQHARERVHVLDEIIVLGARPRDADRVAFLEGVVADEMGRHLAGDADDRDRIHQRVGQAGDGVGGAGTGGDENDADLAGRAGVAFGGVNGALLVADENVLEAILLKQLIVDRQHGAARIAENVLNALIGESLKHHLGAGHRARHRLSH